MTLHLQHVARSKQGREGKGKGIITMYSKREKEEGKVTPWVVLGRGSVHPKIFSVHGLRRRPSIFIKKHCAPYLAMVLGNEALLEFL